MLHMSRQLNCRDILLLNWIIRIKINANRTFTRSQLCTRLKNGPRSQRFICSHPSRPSPVQFNVSAVSVRRDEALIYVFQGVTSDVNKLTNFVWSLSLGLATIADHQFDPAIKWPWGDLGWTNPHLSGTDHTYGQGYYCLSIDCAGIGLTLALSWSCSLVTQSHRRHDFIRVTSYERHTRSYPPAFTLTPKCFFTNRDWINQRRD